MQPYTVPSGWVLGRDEHGRAVWINREMNQMAHEVPLIPVYVPPSNFIHPANQNSQTQRTQQTTYALQPNTNNRPAVQVPQNKSPTTSVTTQTQTPQKKAEEVNKSVPVQYPNHSLIKKPIIPQNTTQPKTTTADPDTITFTINGKSYSVTNPDPSVSLNQFIRNTAGLTGTKRSCAEGGCGACVVMLNYYDATLGQMANVAVNSCLKPLPAVNGMNVVTVEGIGSSKTGLNPIQERIAEGNGTQCGFCTPGMVMNMYSLLQTNPNPTQQEIEKQFDGNLCRCTGYRPILSAMKTFGTDYDGSCNKEKCCSRKSGSLVDIEELKSMPKADKWSCMKNQVKFPPSSQLPKEPSSIQSSVNGLTWVSVTSLQQLYALLDANASNYNIKLVVGNTSSGVYKDSGYNYFIDISAVPELKAVSMTNTGPVIGAAVTISDLIVLLQNWASDPQYQSYQTAPFTALANHMLKIANYPVRNAASWAGNLRMAHDEDANGQGGFPSDMLTILMGSGASIVIGNSLGTKTVSLTEFRTVDMTRSVILSVFIPFGVQGSTLWTYKVSLRHVNSHAIINCALNIQVNSSNVVIGTPILTYGGVKSYAIRMTNTENYLIGKNITSQSTLSGALNVLQAEAVPDPVTGQVKYRSSLVTSLFYKFFLAIQPALPSSLQLASSAFDRPVSQGYQSYETSPSEYPVSEPVPKLTGKIQATGETKYTDDFPNLSKTLYAALVISTVAVGTVQSINTTTALAAPGVVAFYSASDISPQQNQITIQVPDEQVFATNIEYYGQTIGIIIADTQDHANAAAKLVEVTYSNVGTPILTIEDAIAKNSYFPDYGYFIGPVVSGNIVDGFNKSTYTLDGSVSVGAQYHFHMETQAVYCIPDEDNRITIYGGLQWASQVQKCVANTLNKKLSDIEVKTRQSGGSYGAKISRNIPPFCAVAFASDQLGLPVKMVMDLNTNMENVGKRNPFLCNYKVGFDANGKLQAVKVELYVDGGAAYDANNGTAIAALFCVDNCYYSPTAYYDSKICKTNTPPNTSMRGPGWVPAVFFMEHMMEQIAKFLNKNPDDIKQLNFYNTGQMTPYRQKLLDFNVPTIWDQLKKSCDYDNRLNQVQQFNANNRWNKKGISLVPVKFGVYWSAIQMGALINVYTDGTVSVSHSGTEIGQGINTKVAQTTAMMLGIDLSQISILDSGTLTVPNAQATGGSVTSELCSQAVMSACQTINQRLAPYRTSGATWQQAVSAAISAGVDLQAKGWVNPGNSDLGPQQYSSYGATCLESQIDVLTGEIQILRTDILFDCGVSMNPAIDIGQVEGAFVQGLGYYLTETIDYDKDGVLTTNGTWEYKPPSAYDIPIDFRVALLKNSSNPFGVLNSKAVGEPPLCMSCSVVFAAQHAIYAARSDIGNTNSFTLDAPATVEQIQQNCLVDISQFSLQ